MADLVENIYKDYKSILDYFTEKQEITFRSISDAHLKKSLILCIASYFETKIIQDIESFFESKTSGTIIIKHFLTNKALKRQYHTFFNWEGNNANTFFSLFGTEFSDYMKEKVKNDSELQDAITNFIEIGRERNRLVHQNYGQFSIEKTLEEIYASYKKGSSFVSNLTIYLNQFSSEE